MAQTGYTPIQLYRSTTASAVPSASNLNPGELAININDADMALYAENASGAVKRIMNNPAGLKYPTADGTSGQVMTTDGAGNVTFTSTLNVTTVNATTVDTTNIEVTTLKAKDGTSAGSIADSTGVVTLASSVLTTTDINGGTIDGAVIGGSSAAAGTFTTVTASGDVTIADKIVHSGDTNTAIRFPAADTVTVETSGAERLRVTSAGLVGIGTSSPTADLSVGSATSSSGNVHLRTSKTTFELTPSNSDAGGMDINVGFVAGGQGPLKFSLGSTERMRITSSGNLLLGTTTDFTSTTTAGGMALTGYGVYPFTTASTGTANTTALSSLNVTSNLTSTGSASAVLYGSVSAPTLSNDGTGGSNSTQVIGVMGQPAIGATGSSARVAAVGIVGQVDRGNAADFSTNSSGFYQGATLSARHLTTLPSTAVSPRLTGAVATATNNSGTATSQASFVAAVQSGSSSSSPNTAATTMAAFENLTFTVGAATSLGTATVTDGYGVKLIGPTVAATGTMTNYYAFRADAPTVTGTLTNRYGIWINDSLSTNYFAGNVGIGTSSPSARLQANNTINTVYSPSDTLTSGAIAYIRNDSSTNATAATLRLDALGSANVAAASISAVHTGDAASALTFGTRTNASSNVTERARIDSSGNLLVGTTTGSDKLLVRGASARLTSDGLTSNATLTVQAHNGAGYDAQLYLECPGSFGGGMFAARSVSQIRVWCGNQAAGVSLANSAASWGSYSDERIKDIIEPITDAANKVSSLRAVIGKYKSDAPEKRRSFLIAQDVQAVLPEAVYQNSEEDDTLSLAYTDVIPLLVAAIQELKAEVDSLRAQLNP